MMHKRPSLIIFFIGCFFIGNVFAQTNQSELDHILHEMKNIKINLQKKYDKKNELQFELKKIESQFGETARYNRELNQQIFKQRVSIAALTNTAAINADQLHKLQQALASQLHMAYILKSQNPLKLILTQQDPNQVNRNIYYYSSLNHKSLEAILQLQNNLSQINSQRHQLFLQYQNLQLLQHQQQLAENKLATMRINRTQLVSEIDHTINNQNQILKKLTADKDRLEKTLNQLKPISWPQGNSNFASLKGHLPWPTQGKVLHYFNTPIEQSEINWTGELIAAPEDQPIYSVANGIVVFAKWLEGYGLLLIINHGNGYMTLYGRNHSLYKHEGDSVKAGEMIGSVGESGGFSAPSLYFAILYNAKPLDPSQWCS